MRFKTSQKPLTRAIGNNTKVKVTPGSPKGQIHSSTEHLLDHEAGGTVEEEGKEGGETEKDEGLEDGPAVLVPDDVSNRLERVAEPDERRVGAAERETHTRVGFVPLLCSLGSATRHVNRY